jgi:phosphate transport system ATP-binding protein
MTPAIVTENLSVFWGDRQVLRDINLSIPYHSITAIIGASGCGKSTFLKCLNRIAELEGRVRIQGRVTVLAQDIYHPAVNLPVLRRHVGMVFQKPTAFPMSIYQNVAYGAKHYLPRSEIGWAVEKALRQANLWEEVKDRLHSSALALSGGQQQRLCIARALAVQPQILLLDEPCSALDPLSTEKIEQLVVNLKTQLTIVIVTHNLAQAERIAQQTAFFASNSEGVGQLIEFQETATLFHSPQSPLTRDYVSGRIG